MKFLVAFLAIMACVSAEEFTPKSTNEINAIRSECFEAHPLTKEQMSHLENFIFPNEEAVRKYIMCAYEKMDLYSSHEGFNADRIAKQYKMDMEEEELKKMVEDCISKHPKGDHANDVHIYEVQTCFIESEVGQKLKAIAKKRQEEKAQHA